MARPRKYNAEDIQKSLSVYIEGNDDPMIEEYIMGQPFSKSTLHDYARDNELLSDTIKDLHNKQQVRTVRGVEAGKIPVAFGIFKLKQKQYGWTDKHEVEQTIKDVTVLDDVLEQLNDNIE
ncbi:terminase small subunit [PinkBerry-associated phage LS06-2018-MD08]|nr:terminase small subunit [PinkBerry-associated phage LS06-2018-MD08]